MAGLVYLIERIAPALFLVIAALMLIWLRSLMLSRRRLRLAEFELERDMAEAQRARSITWTIGLLELALAVGAVAYVIAPTLRVDVLTGGASGPLTADLGATGEFETSTPGGDGSGGESLMLTVTAQALAGEQGQRLLLTPIASATPVGTILPGYPTPVDCGSADASLLVPAPGQVVFDSLTIIGTANAANFAFYKFELAGPSTGGSFAPILGERASPVTEQGVLGQIPLSPFQPGDYDFRLAVFDNTGELRASCTVRIVVRDRPPTATPPGGAGL
jgi:hypothetical protein